MPDLATERATLVRADQDIAEGKIRVAAQAARLERLRRHGHETDQAELLLANLQQTLAVWKVHRELILQEIERLEQIS